MQDLDKIEHSLMEIERIMYNKLGGEYMSFEKKTLLRAWEFLSGEVRPKPSDQFVRSQSTFKKAKLPASCKGPVRRP